ncbi:MAG: hypothetical protein GY778_03425 [bacterium]|nr:hypothetical protein [bacterium]
MSSIGRLMAVTVWGGLALMGWSAPARAHFFVLEGDRVGAAPAYDGGGWLAEVYLNIPEESIGQLITVEAYVAGLTPDFTFRTEWIDFPAGPAVYGDPQDDLDAGFATMGDFLDGPIFDVSDPAQLNASFGHFFIRFSGLLKVAMDHDTDLIPGLPIDIYFATYGFDGYRTRVGTTSIYRVANTAFVGGNGLFTENGLLLGVGLFPIEVTYFNRYDPAGADGNQQAGIELYSWHGTGPDWPTGAGQQLVHPVFGPMTLVSPDLIYRPEDVGPVVKGDFDADFDFDLFDFQWFQWCYTGDLSEIGGTIGFGCSTVDFDDDVDVDGSDYSALDALWSGPGG